MSDYSVGSLTARAGEKVSGFVPVPGLDLELPVFVVNGQKPGKVLAITAGVHGAEYVGCLAALRFAKELDPKTLKGTVVIVTVSNPPGFFARVPVICPLDGRNLNRAAPDPQGTATEKIMNLLWNDVISKADSYIDLHGGDIQERLLPFSVCVRTGDNNVDDASVRLARNFGIHYVVQVDDDDYPISRAAQHGIPAIIAESGDSGEIDERFVNLHLEGLRNVAKDLAILPGSKKSKETVLVTKLTWILAKDRGMVDYPVRLGEQVKRGQVVARVSDLLGNEVAEYAAPHDGVILFHIRTLALKKGDVLAGVGF